MRGWSTGQPVFFRRRVSQYSKSSRDGLSVSLTNENRTSTSMSSSISSWSILAAARRSSSSCLRRSSRAAFARAISSCVSFLPDAPVAAGLGPAIEFPLFLLRMRLTSFFARRAMFAWRRFSAAPPSRSSAARSSRSRVLSMRMASASQKLGSRENATHGSLSSLFKSTNNGRTYRMTNFWLDHCSPRLETAWRPWRIGVASCSSTPRARSLPSAVAFAAHTPNVALTFSP
mmetsp:Transcript_8779/g.17052  ORF Transcript_8779/g.17052 Transcript_8779/m.17052 type:complete len:231 (+) Transcript_8779:395-1087(+)